MITVTDKIKIELIEHIKSTAKEHNLSQRDLCKAMNLQNGRVSNLLDGKKYMFTVEELIKCTEAIGFGVELKIVKG